MNQIRESLNNVVFPDTMPDLWPYQSWCSPADIDTDITWYSFSELDLTLNVWLGPNALIPVQKSIWGFVYENEPLVQINIKDDTAFIAINRRFYSWVIIVSGAYNLNISLDLSTIFKHTALADTALCMIANRVDTQSVKVALNTAKSFMNFVFFHELVQLICCHHQFINHNENQSSYIRTIAFIADFLAFENSIMPFSGDDVAHKRNRDLEIGTARSLGFIIASYFIIKTKQMSNVNAYPTVNERTILLLSYILSPYLKRSEWTSMLLKHEARGVIDAYDRRRKLGFNIANNDPIISTEHSTCHCNCSKCSAFANEVYTKAKPLNTEVLNHMDVYAECFSKSRNIITYPNLGTINNKKSYFCGLKHPVLFSLENSIKRLI
ncbi:TPA: hypothetical protein ACNVDX_004512 [Citrobacter gillenii]